MKVNIYYGGRGLIEDPTIYVINKLTDVLQELRATVTRYNLFEQKSGIAMLPNTLKDADAVILAVSVEWYGIGGFMQQFLDSCWLYADKTKLKKLYMFPVVISTTAGEQEARYQMIRAWELLGGRTAGGFSAYVADHVEFETDEVYAGLIEKKAEEIYRTVHQKSAVFPSSAGAEVAPLSTTAGIELTPQESEQLSEYVSDDNYVRKQKEDVELLSQMYRTKMDMGREEGKQEFIKTIKDSFSPAGDPVRVIYAIQMTDTGRTIVIDVDGDKLKCSYSETSEADVTATTTREIVNKLVNGRITFQGAFMSGAMVCKGDFKLLRSFDQLFRFK